MDKRGRDYHYFPSKLFCLTVPKNFVEVLCFRENPVTKKIMDKRGV